MLMKIKRDEGRSGCGQKTLSFLSRMTRSSKTSPYKKMESEIKEKKKSSAKKPEESSKGKENNKTLTNKQAKEKKSKKGWKRVRQAALTTCRYIGMGAAHMSPATIYSSPDYYADPKYWDKSFSSSYKPKKPPQTPHWTSNMMFSGW